MTLDRFPRREHNHTLCVSEAMTRATSLCEQQHLRFTPIRQQVLELIWARHAPVSAYDLLKALRMKKGNAEAPTVYRALDFLLEHGLVHKIESLNAFVGCDQPQQKHHSQFLICIKCQQIIELDDMEISNAVTNQATSKHFLITDQTIELKGYCASCRP